MNLIFDCMFACMFGGNNTFMFAMLTAPIGTVIYIVYATLIFGQVSSTSCGMVQIHLAELDYLSKNHYFN